jgi:hypothetical protein
MVGKALALQPAHDKARALLEALDASGSGVVRRGAIAPSKPPLPHAKGG